MSTISAINYLHLSNYFLNNFGLPIDPEDLKSSVKSFIEHSQANTKMTEYQAMVEIQMLQKEAENRLRFFYRDLKQTALKPIDDLVKITNDKIAKKTGFLLQAKIIYQVSQIWQDSTFSEREMASLNFLRFLATNKYHPNKAQKTEYFNTLFTTIVLPLMQAINPMERFLIQKQIEVYDRQINDAAMQCVDETMQIMIDKFSISDF